MSYSIRQIAGIGPAMAAKLKSLGIRTTDGLLEASKTVKARKKLAEDLEVSEQTILLWANLVDRMRIKGVREPYAQLLKDAGVDTVTGIEIPQSRAARRGDGVGEREAQACRCAADRKACRGLDRIRPQARAENPLLLTWLPLRRRKAARW